ncbi:MAG: response regulator [Dehalococcoidales bacterium]|nr:response regulator [Dehalococcoidales bacterium]
MKNNNPGSILILEDEKIIREICARILAREGFKVDFAENGEIGQTMVAENEYSCILVDIRLPVVDGITFFNWLKSTSPDMVQRVIFVSGDVMARDTHEFVLQSQRPFLPKPFTPGQLTDAIHEIVN